MRRIGTGATIGLALAGLLLAACSGGPGESPQDTMDDPSSDESAEEFFEGKQIDIIGGHDAGSGFDFYMRSTADAIERTSDHTTVVRNLPGGGGTLGDNELFAATPDGLTIGLLNFPGHAFAQLTGSEAVRYDFAEWEWLGRVASGPPVLLVSADGPFASVDDLVNADTEVRFAIEEAGSDAYYGAQVAGRIFGFPSRLVTGYEGSSAVLAAIIRGEADATFISYGGALQGIQNGDLKALMVFSDEVVDAISDVPLAIDLVSSEEDRETLRAFGNVYSMERVFVAPPETPADRVDYLRALLEEAFQDEVFAKTLEDAGRPLNPLPGDEVADAIQAVVAGVSDLEELLN